MYAEAGKYPFAYERRADGERILVILNPADREEPISFDCSGDVLFQVGGVPADGKVPARSACVILR